jgi:hypothetical protein
MNLGRISRRLISTIVLSFGLASMLFAQSDMERKTVAITYPLDETVTIKFVGTTLLRG